MSSNNASPQGGQYSQNDSSTDETRPLPGHNPAIAKYNPLQIKPDTVVRPDFFTLYFGFLGNANWKRKVAYSITDRVENHYVLTARSPNQGEMDAIVEHGTRSLYYNRIGIPTGAVFGGAWIYYRTRSSPSWPRDNPTPKAILNSMRVFTESGTLKQVAANVGWKMLISVSIFGTLSSIYAAFNDAQNMLSDPRLKHFLEDMRKQKPEDVRRRKLQAASERVRIVRSGEKDIGSQYQQAIGQPDGFVSDAYAYQQDPESTPANSYSEYESSNSSQSTSNSSSNQQSPPAQSSGPVWARGRGTQPEQSSGTGFFDDDDASPTAAEYRNVAIDGSSSGSAWDRIRSQNAGRRPQPPQQSQNSYSAFAENNGADQDQSWSAPRSEKDQAQAEFDRMIEAERNVGNEGSSRRRGWGS